MTHDIIALVGADASGKELLESLLSVPGVEVRYVFDADPAAPGIALARERGILCRTDWCFDELSADADVDLILDTTGDPDVLAKLASSKHPDSRLLDAAARRLVCGLLEQLAAAEQRITELTETVEQIPTEKACYVRQASHQIKSPLSSIQSYVNVLLGGYAGELPDRARDIVEKIHTRCDAALGNLAKCRTLADMRCVGHDALAVSTVHLNVLIGQAVERHTDLAAQRHIELRITVLDGTDFVECDPQMAVTLLSELVENAVVYSHDGGLVEIGVTALDDDRLTVSIRDQGIGIPERCLPRIFDEDYRADIAKKHHPDGAGVGLTTAREIADLNGFDLAVESEEGRGSVFTLRVPRAPKA